jgi:hypothetical protein
MQLPLLDDKHSVMLSVVLQELFQWRGVIFELKLFSGSTDKRLEHPEYCRGVSAAVDFHHCVDSMFMSFMSEIPEK